MQQIDNRVPGIIVRAMNGVAIQEMAENKVFRIALIGAGRIGKVHAMNIHHHPESVVHYVVDPVADVASSLAATVGAQVVEPEVGLCR